MLPGAAFFLPLLTLFVWRLRCNWFQCLHVRLVKYGIGADDIAQQIVTTAGVIVFAPCLTWARRRCASKRKHLTLVAPAKIVLVIQRDRRTPSPDWQHIVAAATMVMVAAPGTFARRSAACKRERLTFVAPAPVP